jgi:hypothetical protein
LPTIRSKLIYYYGKRLGPAGSNPAETWPEWGLLDLNAEPREMKNLYYDQRYVPVVRYLKTALDRLQRETGHSPV